MTERIYLEPITTENDKNQTTAAADTDTASTLFAEEREPDEDLQESGPSTVSNPKIVLY